MYIRIDYKDLLYNSKATNLKPFRYLTIGTIVSNNLSQTVTKQGRLSHD